MFGLLFGYLFVPDKQAKPRLSDRQRKIEQKCSDNRKGKRKSITSETAC